MVEITHFFEALWQLSISMAPYILFGLFFAGILHEIVPDSIVSKHLGKDNISSVVKSTLFGIPLPVCSCGVVPLATSIKKSGASKGATLSFLISTPITGVDSIMATYGIFGWIFTLYRVITSMVIAMIAGILTNIFDKEMPKSKSTFSTSPATAISGFTFAPKKEMEKQSCCSMGSSDTIAKSFSFTRAINYAFGTLLSDIAKPLLWGLLLGALIAAAIPENLSELLREYRWLSYLVVIAIAIPMYVCATASLPIAAGLMLSGVSAGAAFVFLTAGPATNTITIAVVKKMLGTKSLMIYLGSIIIGSILFGLVLDSIFDISKVDPASLVHLHEKASFISQLSAVILWCFVLYFVLKSYFRKKGN